MIFRCLKTYLFGKNCCGKDVLFVRKNRNLYLFIMKRKDKEVAKKATLKFKKDFENLEDLRTEISSCLITKNSLWLSYDEDAGIERLTKKKLKKNYKFNKHKHYELSDFFDLPADDEMDIEALAYAEPYLWFCGSMSLKRDTPDPEDGTDEQLDALLDITRDKNRFSLGCIPCIENDGDFELHHDHEFLGHKIEACMMRGGTHSSELNNALLADPHLQMFMQVPCKDNGFDIEGLAVEGERIFIGLRGPVIGGYAIILEIKVTALNRELVMQQRDGEHYLYRKHFVDLKGMGIRELNIDKKGDMYILAGPTMDLDGTISIFKIENGIDDAPSSFIHEPIRLFDVARGSEVPHGKEKAEGMALMDEDEILITYDSPLEKRLKGKRKVVMDVYQFGEKDS